MLQLRRCAKPLLCTLKTLSKRVGTFIASHNDREEEVRISYQQRQLELKSEAVRDLVQVVVAHASTQGIGQSERPG